MKEVVEDDNLAIDYVIKTLKDATGDFYYLVKEIPESTIGCASQSVIDKRLVLGDPNDLFASTDLVPPSAYFKQLIFYYEFEDGWILLYRQGGIAFHVKLMLGLTYSESECVVLPIIIYADVSDVQHLLQILQDSSDSKVSIERAYMRICDCNP